MIKIIPMTLFLSIITSLVNFNIALSSSNSQDNRKIVKEMFREYQKEFQDVPILETKKVTKDWIIVDARQEEEQMVSMIPRAISKSKFEELNFNKAGTKIAVYCTIGYRSGQYATQLRAKGYDAYNLEGSILGWIHDGGKLVDRYGKEVKKIHVYGEKWNFPPKDYKTVF